MAFMSPVAMCCIQSGKLVCVLRAIGMCVCVLCAGGVCMCMCEYGVGSGWGDIRNLQLYMYTPPPCTPIPSIHI